MQRFVLVFMLLAGIFARASDIKYPAGAIPENLKKNADVVKRMEEYEFRIINTGEAVLHHKYALTILNENGDDHAVLIEYYDKLGKIVSIEGSLYDTPDILNKSGRRIDVDESRTVDFVFNAEWRDEDNYEIEIPVGYQLESTPQDVSLKTKFGMYSCTTKLIGNEILFQRVREQYSGRFPAKDQVQLAKFYNDIYKADRGKLVFVKKAQ